MHDFLLQEEGYTTRGYVPNNDGEVIGRSGLTIAAGVDIGQMDIAEFNRMPMSAAGRETLRPFVGRRGQEALDQLGVGLLIISDSDAQAMSNYAFDTTVTAVRDEWESYDTLPEQAQIVLVSLAYNLGVRGSPSTSGKIADYRFEEAVDELRDPGEWTNRELDGRRNREADLLEEFLT